MQAHAEHEQDDAQIGEFLRDMGIGDIAWRERTGDHAGHQVAREDGQAQSMGDRAEDESEDEATDDGGDEWRGVVHGRLPESSLAVTGTTACTLVSSRRTGERIEWGRPGSNGDGP